MRTWAIIEREMRRFRRSPTLIVMALMMPIMQLVILGYAFGGNVKHLKVGVVDRDHGVPALKIRELCQAVTAGREDLRHRGLRRRGTGDRGFARWPDQRRADDSAGLLAPDAGRRVAEPWRSSRTTATTS